MTIETVRQYFEERVPTIIVERADDVSSMDCVYEFQITGDNGGTWMLNLSSAPYGIIEQATGSADCTVIMKDEFFLEMINGKLSPQMAFLTGKLKVTGNMALALKLTTLFN